MSPLLLLVTSFGADDLSGFSGFFLSWNEKFPLLEMQGSPPVCYPQFQEREAIQ